ncbi:hypothetical protein PCASD_17146 [Puccinia coronata f. sp. avenae]|uniref:Uncharacterized protein n=1 Tax=Puccinia coronata f. sp. avenae TaxID=200324 RepID=A0A2N5SH98_9BASI|nr:hypothetical protein PCASD_17146 [Puccinia coronata f. sp. avenae]
MVSNPTTPVTNPTKQPKKKAIPWERDGVDGGDSSMTILLNWITSDSNYQRWRGDTEHGKTKKSLCSEILEILKENGIHHRDTKGISQRITDLQTSYNTARDWRRNTGAGILESDLANGVKTVEDQLRTICRFWDILDPIMSSRSVADPLYTRSSISAAQNAQEKTPAEDSSNPPSGLDLSSGQVANDVDEESQTLTPTPALASAATSNKKKKKKKKNSVTGKKGASTRVAKSKNKKNPEDFFMKSMISKRQTEMMKARAEVSKAKLEYMKGLKDMGLDFTEVQRLTEKEFPAPTDFLNELESGSSDSSDED